MCIGPVSPETINAADLISDTRSAIVVGGETAAVLSEAEATAAAIGSSPGPHNTIDRRP
jgi:hypothetical protein